ncbi:MAG: 50S ribosomal protein L19e [Thermoprotei archaeon]|jgi:large subunit ribosomal protein L19e
MSLDHIKELAARELGVGKSRIWLDPDEFDTLSSVISREEIRSLIKSGVIQVKQKKGISRGRTRIRKIKKAKGLKKGPGSRKGHKANIEKRLWVMRARALRSYLRDLKEKKLIDVKTYRLLRSYIKGGIFRSKSQLKAYLLEHDLLKRKIR